MADYKLAKPLRIRCAECGGEITTGRSDKKFCCDSCRHTYNNRNKRFYRSYKLKVENSLERNHKVLENLLKMGISEISMSDILNLGFNPAFITSFQRNGCHTECSCYDITFILMDSKIIGIRHLAKLHTVD